MVTTIGTSFLRTEGDRAMKKIILSNTIRLAATATALLLPCLTWADTAPLAGDAFINAGDGSNYGSLPAVNVGGVANSQGLLLFNLGSLPGGTVAWARLRIYANNVPADGTLDLGAANAPLAEASVSRFT